MANYTFDAGAQGWFAPGPPTGMEWTNTAGSPGLGCLVGGDPFGVDPGGNGASASITGLSIPMVVGDPYSCRFRVINDGEGGSDGEVHGRLQLIGDLNTYNSEVIDTPVVQDVYSDSGWLLITGSQTPEDDTIHTVQFLATTTGDAVSVIVYLDSVYVKETPPDDLGATLYYGTNNISNSVPIMVT